MKCYQVSKEGGQFELVDRPIPKPNSDQILIKLISCGICKGDTSIKDSIFPGVKYPLVLGHEIIGEIVELGSNIKNLKKNDIVGLGIPAGYMFDGGFSQYMVAKENDLVKIPKGLSPVESAPLLCAGVTTYSALKNCGAKSGELVAICGIGGLGHLALQYANKMGFKTVAISRNEDKKELSMKLGAKYYFSTEKGDFSKEIKDLGGAKAVILTGPSENIGDKLIDCIQEGGKLMLVGTNNKKMDFSINSIIFGRKIIQGWICFDNEVKKECLEFSLKNEIKPMTEIYKFEDFQKGYDNMSFGKARFRSVIKFN